MAAAITVVTSVLYYIVLGNAWLRLRGIDPNTAEVTPQAWQMVGRVARTSSLPSFWPTFCPVWGNRPKEALRLGFLVWFGFEAMAVVGSVLREGYPLGLYLIHVGGALQATLVMALILGAWRGGDRRDVEISPSASTSS